MKFLNFKTLITTLAFCAVTGTACATENLKVGVLYNISGVQAPLDKASLQGAELAVKNINAAGGVLGKPVELIIRDGKSDTKIVADEAGSLAKDPTIVGVIGLSDSDMALAAIKPLAEAKKIFLTSGATSPALPSAAPGYVFLACFSDNQQAAAAANFAHDQLKFSQGYIIVNPDLEYGQQLSKYFQQSFSNKGGKILKSIAITQTQNNIVETLKALKAQAEQPQFFYIATGPTLALAVVKQIHQAGFTTPIVGGDAFDSLAMRKLSSTVDNSIYFTLHAFFADHSKQTVEAKQFIASYEKLYGHVPDGFAGLGYDSIRLLAAAIDKAHSTNAAEVRTALLSLQHFAGVTGDISYQQHPIPQKTIYIAKLQHKKLELAAAIL